MNVTLTTSWGNNCDNSTHSNLYDYNNVYSFKELYNADILHTMEFTGCKYDLVQYIHCNNENINSVCVNGQLEKNNCEVLSNGQSVRHTCKSNESGARSNKVKWILLVGLMLLCV